MPDTFSELYRGLLKDVFLDLAHQQMEQGADGLTSADAYAEQGKPEFTLAYLLLTDATDEVKRDILARSYERRAIISEEKAEDFTHQFHRPFPNGQTGSPEGSSGVSTGAPGATCTQRYRYGQVAAC